MNKQEEKAIFDAVMDEEWTANSIASESPDFVCIKDGAPFLGVEVTDLYVNESDARLVNIADYMGEILESKDYRHKDDKKNLPLEKFTFNSKDGPLEIEGIFQWASPIEDRFKRLQETILTKARKLPVYLRKAPAADLIIVDKGEVFKRWKKEHVAAIFQHPETRAVVQSSGFREIRFVCQVNSGESVVLFARLNIFIEEIYKFKDALSKVKPEHSKAEFITLLAIYLKTKGFHSASAVASINETAIISDVAMFVFSGDQNKVIDLTPSCSPLNVISGEAVELDLDDRCEILDAVFKATEHLSYTANVIRPCAIKLGKWEI